MKDVYKVISAVSAEIAKNGISKNKTNKQQGYSFRGIDDIYNAISSPLSTNGLVILPRVLSREVVERSTKSGSANFYVTVEVEYDLIAASDGSSHTVKAFGEAADMTDKATNKAMSAAYKYMAMQVFCIPTEGEDDADEVTHEPSVRTKASDANSADRALKAELFRSAYTDAGVSRDTAIGILRTFDKSASVHPGNLTDDQLIEVTEQIKLISLTPTTQVIEAEAVLA